MLKRMIDDHNKVTPEPGMFNIYYHIFIYYT